MSENFADFQFITKKGNAKNSCQKVIQRVVQITKSTHCMSFYNKTPTYG